MLTSRFISMSWYSSRFPAGSGDSHISRKNAMCERRRTSSSSIARRSAMMAHSVSRRPSSTVMRLSARMSRMRLSMRSRTPAMSPAESAEIFSTLPAMCPTLDSISALSLAPSAAEAARKTSVASASAADSCSQSRSRSSSGSAARKTSRFCATLMTLMSSRRRNLSRSCSSADM